MVAPAGTPAAIISLMHSETVKVLALPEFLAQFANEGTQPVGNTSQAFRQEIRDNIAKWGQGDQGSQHQAVK